MKQEDTGMPPERRTLPERRHRTVHSLLYGSFHPRRRKPRRSGREVPANVDWHEPWWLAIAVLIVVASCIDAALTLTLLQSGAYEINPLMASLIGGSAAAFTGVKMALTAGGVVLLTVLVRTRVFGKIPVSVILYLVLAGYGVLIAYEMRLLDQIVGSS